MDIRQQSDINGNYELVDFKSLQEFYEYVISTPLNESFRWQRLASVSGTAGFTGTATFEEAAELLRNGWQEMSETLVQRLKVDGGKVEPVMVSKNITSVQGYQPIAPLYLNGIPTNMVSRKMQPVKQKVITLNKSIEYRGNVTTEEIIEESIKALRIIKKLESQSYRCNLNIVFSISGILRSTKRYAVRIRIKSANERLNILKLSFPLVHPSMLRRLSFRFTEVHPGVPSEYVNGYGTTLAENEFRRLYKGEYLLPQFIRRDISKINTLEDLERLDRSW